MSTEADSLVIPRNHSQDASMSTKVLAKVQDNAVRVLFTGYYICFLRLLKGGKYVHTQMHTYSPLSKILT